MTDAIHPLAALAVERAAGRAQGITSVCSAHPLVIEVALLQAQADGARMRDPEGAFNLLKFPPDQHDRFVTSVTRGKNQMPSWGDFFKPDQLEALWAYVVAGER